MQLVKSLFDSKNTKEKLIKLANNAEIIFKHLIINALCFTKFNYKYLKKKLEDRVLRY